MSKGSIQQFSTTAAANTDIAGINVNTGWSPANVGPTFREQMALLASSLIPLLKTVTGLTAVTLSAAEASAQVIVFNGILAADCTVTLPNALFIGMAINATSGGHNVILTSGGGATATIPDDSPTAWTYFSDSAGGTNLLGTFLSQTPIRTWRDQTAFRAQGVVYTNSTSHEMEVNVSAHTLSSPTFPQLRVDAVPVGVYQLTDPGQVFFTAEVPAGSTYEFFFTNGIIDNWAELS